MKIHNNNFKSLYYSLFCSLCILIAALQSEMDLQPQVSSREVLPCLSPAALSKPAGI